MAIKCGFSIIVDIEDESEQRQLTLADSVINSLRLADAVNYSTLYTNSEQSPNRPL